MEIDLFTQETLQKAHRAARVANLSRWASYALPTWNVRQPGMLADILKDAQRNADVTGIPQRIRTDWNREIHSVVEPDKTVADAVGGTERMPAWVKEALGW